MISKSLSIQSINLLSFSVLLAMSGCGNAQTQVAAPKPLTTQVAQPETKNPFVAALFTDHMMIQRDQMVPVWGWTTPGQSVMVSMAGKTASATAGADGKWLTKIGPFSIGTPQTLTISGPQSATFSDVLVGDVWLCSGQSNMWLPVKNANNGVEEAANANYPQIRYFDVPSRATAQPLSTFMAPAAWKVTTPDTAKDFSAVAYYFARHLNQNLKVPIGLVHASVGATTIEAWSSAEALKTIPNNERDLADFEQWKQLVIEWDKYDADPALFDRLMADWYLKNDAGSFAAPAWSAPEADDSGWKTMNLPGPWYDRGLAGFEGVAWFRKDFEIPDASKNKDLVLHLGSIDRRDTVWVNGVEVGHSISNGWARQYKVAANLLRAGRNVVAVRILGSSGFRGNENQLKLAESGDPNSPTVVNLVGAWRYKEGVTLNKAERVPSTRSGNPSIPTALYNGAIAPIIPFAIKGAIWYQGESSANNPNKYRQTLPALIKDWRARFGAGDFPFLIVQLANFGETHAQPADTQWAQLRAVQAEVARTIPKSGLAVTIDIGEPKDVHPKNKQEVGRRLGLVAQNVAYSQKVEDSGPTFQALKIEGNKLRLSFDHSEGLTVKDGQKLQGFAISGDDQKWVWADAVIEGQAVVLSSPQVGKPIAVRYAWDDSPLANLTNKTGLPAVPFRS